MQMISRGAGYVRNVAIPRAFSALDYGEPTAFQFSSVVGARGSNPLFFRLGLELAGKKQLRAFTIAWKQF
jgi:hypothetical protein